MEKNYDRNWKEKEFYNNLELKQLFDTDNFTFEFLESFLSDLAFSEHYKIGQIINEAVSNLNRKVTDEEYDSVVEYALNLGVKNAFVQEGEAASESFIPDFNKKIV